MVKMKCDKYEVGGDRDDDGGVEWRDCDRFSVFEGRHSALENWS